MKNRYKRIIAIAVALLLLIGTIPVLAVDTLPVVVVDPTGETSGSYNTMTAAIDALGGEAGKVYVKGALSAAGAALEGTIENREPIIIAGYDDNAANGTITIDTAKVTGESWTKGDITFENITILPGGTGAAGKSEYGISSGKHTITFGAGIKTGSAASGIWSVGTILNKSDSRLTVGSYPGSNSDLNVNITSGNYYTVQALLGGDKSASTTSNMNVTINVSGTNGKDDPNNGTFIEYLGIGGTQDPPTSSYALHTINGDVTFNLSGGYVQALGVRSYGRSAVNVLGDTIVNISGCHVQDGIFTIMREITAPTHANYKANIPEYNNVAIIVDASKTQRTIIGSTVTANCQADAKNPAHYPMAEGKHMIGIFNNVPDNYNPSSGNVRFNTSTPYAFDSKNYHTFDLFDYRLIVKGGYAQPVFVRTNPDDPSTSYLKGFTFESNVDGYVPTVNGKVLKVNESYPEHEGKKVYDLSDFIHTREDAVSGTAAGEMFTTVAFAEDFASDGRPPVVSTDASFTPDSAYKKYATISGAIGALGEEGGTIYVKGEYTITDMGEFAGTKNLLDGKKLTIVGYTADGSATADNILNFGNCDLKSAWLYSDIEFNNIKIKNTLSGNENKGFNSNGNTIIFGDNIVTELKNAVVGNVVNGITNNIVINSGTFTGLFAHKGWGGQWNNAGTAVNYTINGGSFNPVSTERIYMGFSSSNNAKDEASGVTYGTVVSVPYINWKINGGDFNDAYIRTTGDNLAKTNVTGALVLDVAGGTNLKQIELYPSVKFTEVVGSTAKYEPVMSNIAVILDASKSKTSVNSYLGTTYGIKNTNENNGKKYIVCVNNYAGSNAVFNAGSSLDYIINTTGGVTKPVFEETTPGDASTSTLKGFTIVPNAENAGKNALIDGVKLIPDADDIYDLSAVAEDKGQIFITFGEGVVADSNVDNFVITKGSTYNYISNYIGNGGKLIIPSNGNVGAEKMLPVYSIGASAFNNAKDKILGAEISEGIISIDDAAFKGMPNLTSVKLPTSLKVIGKEAFANSGITGEVEIPKNVTTLSDSAFAGNAGITKVYFYSETTVIGTDSIPTTATIYGVKGSTAQAYAKKMNIKFVEIKPTAKETLSDVIDNGNYDIIVNADGVITGYERKDASKPYSLKVTIPSEIGGVKVTGIGENVFEVGNEASSVYAVVIPEGVTEIGTNAFKGNLKLTLVSLPKSLQKIGGSAFEETKLSGSIKLPETVTDIGKNAFNGVNTLSSITVENKACVINDSAFPKGVETFTLYGYTDSTAAKFAEENSINFVALDATSSENPGGSNNNPGNNPGNNNPGNNPGNNNPGDNNPGNNNPSNNVGDVKDPVGDIGDQNGGAVTVVRQNNMTTVLIIAIAALAFVMLVGGGIVFFIIYKGKQMGKR